jgi:DNA modification methylase
MPDETHVTIAEAKGRPMLHWVGKRPLDHVTAYPAQLVEVYNPEEQEVASPDGDVKDASGLLFHGDNKDVLAWLLAHGYRGKVDLVYIDPPFDSGADYVRKVELRGVDVPRLVGEAHSLGEQVQYTDIWANDMYLQFMYERLLLLREILSDTGTIYLHADWHKVHLLRCLMDEIFGAENFRNEVHWYYYNKMHDSRKQIFPRATDTLLVYGKTDTVTFNRVEMPREKPVKQLKRVKVDGVMVNLKDEDGNLVYQTREMKTVDNIWPIPLIPPADVLQRTDYPTQKPQALIETIILASSNPGDLVFDCFVGSGTTAASAQSLGRRWIASDINRGAIHTTSKRLQTTLQEQLSISETPNQPKLGLEETKEVASPASLAFRVYRVNDYDLQLQHNEAVNLVVEHVGIDRTRTDAFFDGTLGRRLVKIVPFTHPLTLLDLQALKDELASRRDEDRDVVVVCLGKETAVDPWVADYNHNRPINQIEVIELRTDEKYGAFLVHEPAQADVTIRREGGEVVVAIEDFLSPTIVQRLEMDTPLFKAQIPDWRAMVDVVLIDLDYDGEVFAIDRSDVPARKDDLVAGTYRLPAPDGATTVAVKLIDMLGEEVLVTERV